MVSADLFSDEDFSYSPRPITSGPTQYSTHGILSTLVWGYMVIQFFAKMVVAGTFLTSNCLGCKGCYFCYVHFFSFLILAFNLWPLGYLCYKQHLTLDRFKKAGLFNWGTLFFLIDCGWLITISFCSIKSIYQSVLQITVIPSILLVTCNILVLLIVINYDVDCYDPSQGTEKYFLERRSEESFLSIKPLTIRESGPFRIVIQNLGHLAWLGPMLISRQIYWTSRSSEGKIDDFSENIHFTVVLEEPLRVGEFLTLIPETHSEEGSIRIKSHRSFGMEKGETVITSIANKKQCCVVKLVEEFKKDKLRARHQLQNIEEKDESESDTIVHL